MLDRLIYRSRALWPEPRVAMDGILNTSLWKNAKLEVTGALGFTGRSYVQLLEGPPASLDTLMTSLRNDPRHTEIDVLFRVGTPTRVLPNWTMARIDLAKHSPDVARLVGENDGLGLTNLLVNLVGVGATGVA